MPTPASLVMSSTGTSTHGRRRAARANDQMRAVAPRITAKDLDHRAKGSRNGAVTPVSISA